MNKRVTQEEKYMLVKTTKQELEKVKREMIFLSQRLNELSLQLRVFENLEVGYNSNTYATNQYKQVIAFHDLPRNTRIPIKQNDKIEGYICVDELGGCTYRGVEE